MNMLKARLYDYEIKKRERDNQTVESSKSDIGWGSQIRSYVLDQSRIKDLRTNVESGNISSILDGDIDIFMKASLTQPATLETLFAPKSFEGIIKFSNGVSIISEINFT